MDLYQQYIHKSRYARYLPNHNRREHWGETVFRYTNYWFNKGLIDKETEDLLWASIFDMQVMPSMRALMLHCRRQPPSL
jgi:ribonucleoside-triphosphate reductase